MFPQESDRRDLGLLEAELLIVFEPETFSFKEFAGVLREVPLVIVCGTDDLREEYRDLIGPFDRVAVVGDGRDIGVGEDLILRVERGEPSQMVSSILREIGDLSDLRRRKTVYRTDSEAVRLALSDLNESASGPLRILEVRSEDGPSLIPEAEDRRTSATVGELLLGKHSDGFDVAIVARLLQAIGSGKRAEIIASLWQSVVPGGRIVVVDDFVFDRESREHLSSSPVSISEYTGDILRATSGRATLDFMRALKHPSDVVHRAAILSLYRL